MPVNTAALKTFAPAMRRQLLEAVGRKLDLLLNSQTPDTLSTYAKQIAELREQEAENREQLLEQVAYTWFNRLCALRYLDAKGWHAFGCKVLMPADEGETQPELLKLMRAGSLPAALQSHTDQDRLHGLLDGQVQTAIAGADPQGEVYRELVLAVCRSYHQLMPYLFEGLDDATELLLPDDQITDSSIAGAFRSQISESDCEDVEIIGWLYQFYISEKKDQVIGKVVKSEDIPAATQLFTPSWIVKYMVQNSLGAQWLATYPASALKGQMEYYIEPAEQTDEVKAQLAAITPEALNPEDLTLIDPACGSGHILVEAYELFKAIYLERGYPQRDIPQLILQKNLFGLDIDERAAQLTSFALMMKGRGDDRRLFERGIQLNVMALVNSDGLDVEELANAVNLAEHGLKQADLVELKQLFEHATTFGSLIQVPDDLAEKLPALWRLSKLKEQNMLVAEALKNLEPILRQAKFLSAQYDSVVANPPFMAGKYLTSTLKTYIRVNYREFNKDLFAAFLIRNLSLALNNRFVAGVTPREWMFIGSFERLREEILTNHSITSLVKPSYTSFFESAMVRLISFVIRKDIMDIPGTFFELGYLGSAESQSPRFLAAIANKACKERHCVRASEFRDIPGSPLAFWASESVRAAFRKGEPFGEIGLPRVGMQTSNNEKYLRRWHEISYPDFINSGSSKPKWIKYLKGGSFRKWYGNLEYALWFNCDPGFITKQPNATVLPLSRLCEEKCTWSDISSGIFAARYAPKDSFHDLAGHCFYPSEKLLPYLLAFTNSKPFDLFIGLLSSTVHFQVGDVAKVPVLTVGGDIGDKARLLVEKARLDWDAYERSWDFQSLPCLSVSTDPNPNLESSYAGWIASNKQTIDEMKWLEEENNRLFIDTYDLQDELTPEVPIEQITLTVNPAYRYGGNLTEDELWVRFRQDTIKELLSYAIGCMIPRFQESCHPSDQYIRGLEDMTNASLQRGR
jgi:hypothetical protein